MLFYVAQSPHFFWTFGLGQFGPKKSAQISGRVGPELIRCPTSEYFLSSSLTLSLTRTHTVKKKKREKILPNTQMERGVLERMHSSRRIPVSGDDNETEEFDDESKTKKTVAFSTRFINFVTRYGLLWPCLALAFIVVLFTFSVVFYTRTLVCVSSSTSSYFQPHSRFAFFGFDGLESDFGSLGAPWCKLLNLYESFFNVFGSGIG